MPIYQLELQQPIIGIAVSSQQTLLTQCQHAGLAVTHSCRNGNCGRCFAQLERGRVRNCYGAETIAPATIALCSSFAVSNIELSQIPLENPTAHWYCQALSPQLLRLPAGQQPRLYAGNHLALLLDDTVIVSSISQRSGRELSLTTPLPEGIKSLAIVRIPARYDGHHTLYLATESAHESKLVWSNISLATAKITLEALRCHGGGKKYIMVKNDPS